MLDKKSKILVANLLILITFSIAVTYYKTIVTKNYKIFFDDYEGNFTEDPEEIYELLR